MVDSGCEIDLRWLEGIVGGKVDGQEEDTALKRAITLSKALESSHYEFVLKFLVNSQDP